MPTLRGSRVQRLIATVTVAIGCGGDDASPTTTVAETSSTGGTTASATTESSGVDGSSSESASPLPDPALDPGACGYSGDAFACGWAGSPDHLCPPGTAAGGACTDEPPCCLDDSTVMTCECIDQACEFLWSALDCTNGPGAGACGWDGDIDAYVCGGNAEDPGGSPMACPMVLDEGCGAFAIGTSCCDPDGNAVVCTMGENGGESFWAITDCVIE